MLSTEDAIKLVDLFHIVVLEQRNVGHLPTSDPKWQEAAKAVDAVRQQLLGALTGSSRIDRKAIDPNTETQLVEAVKPADAERGRLRRAGLENLFDELVIRQRRLHEVLVSYIGCEPEKFKLRGRDLLFMVVDLGLFMQALGGPWQPILAAIDADEAEKKARTKFAVRSQEDEAKPMLAAKQAEKPDATPEAAKG